MNRLKSSKNNSFLFLFAGLLGIIIVSGIISSSVRVNADGNDTAVSTASVTVQASCSMTATIDTVHTVIVTQE